MSLTPLRLALIADGAHVNTQRWCEGLASAGAEVHVLTFSGEVPAAKTTQHLPVPALPGKLHYLVAVPFVRNLLAMIRPDVVAACYVTGRGLMAALSGFHPLVQVTSGSDLLLAPAQPAMRLLVRYSLSRADLVTAWAPHMARAAQALGVAPGKILTLPAGIPLRTFVRSSAPPIETKGPVRLISTRSLKSIYRIGTLIRVLSLLLDSNSGYRLTIVGDGPQRAELVAMVHSLGIQDHVEFAGFVPNPELPRLLAAHHLYVSLCPSDGLSSSLLEAMAVGLLPVIVDHPANRAWVHHGENGCLLTDLSPAAIADAICQAAADLPLRVRAWEQNPTLVQANADLYKNSVTYVDAFRRLLHKQ